MIGQVVDYKFFISFYNVIISFCYGCNTIMIQKFAPAMPWLLQNLGGDLGLAKLMLCQQIRFRYWTIIYQTALEQHRAKLAPPIDRRWQAKQAVVRFCPNGFSLRTRRRGRQ